MKDTIYSFKMLSLLIVLAFSNYSIAQEVSLKKQDVKTKEKITTHFSGHLSGNADAYKDKSTLKSTDVKKMQQIVWDAWNEANNKFSEQKLINLDKLEKSKFRKMDSPTGTGTQCNHAVLLGLQGGCRTGRRFPIISIHAWFWR